MAAKNDITGDEIKSKISSSKAYADGWDRIFGKKTQEPKNSRTQKSKKNNSPIV